MDAFRLGLSSKLLLVIVLITLIGVLSTSLLVFAHQRQQLEGDALAETARLSSAINTSLEHAMLHNDQAMVQQIVKDMVANQGIDHIRILDAQGVVQISSQPSEIGDRFDYSDATCQSCDTPGARPGNQTTFIGANDNHAGLLNVNVIYNQLQCQSCHASQTRVLGLTMIEMPLVEMNNQLAAGFWTILLSALATCGMLILLTTYALRVLVIKPVRQLARGMTEIRRGNLDYELPRGRSRDELGDLAETFDMMRARLRSSAIENAELHAKTRTLAILEEHDRLAREMHDNLAQTLGYINLKAALADAQWVLNQPDQARASLLEVKRAAREAYTDVRESIFNLRNRPPSGDGFLSVLTNNLAEYRTRYGIQTHLCMEDERLAEFPVEVQIQVNRIIQEALSNVRKHSQAGQAWVAFERVDHHVRIRIEDDGQGFSPAQPGEEDSKHFGLQIMRERAASVGGDLAIDSREGLGTRIILQIPIYPVIEDPHE